MQGHFVLTLTESPIHSWLLTTRRPGFWPYFFIVWPCLLRYKQIHCKVWRRHVQRSLRMSWGRLGQEKSDAFRNCFLWWNGNLLMLPYRVSQLRTLRNFAQLCTTLHNFAQLCMTLHDFAWLCGTRWTKKTPPFGQHLASDRDFLTLLCWRSPDPYISDPCTFQHFPQRDLNCLGLKRFIVNLLLCLLCLLCFDLEVLAKVANKAGILRAL